MVWSRRFRQNTALRRRRDKKLAKLQLWLWRKRQKNGIFRLFKFKQQVFKKFFCSQAQLSFRKPKAYGSSDVTASNTSDMSNRAEEKKLQMYKVNNGDCQLVSTANVSAVHNNLDGAVADLTLFSHNVHSGANGDIVSPGAEQNLTIDVDLTKEIVAEVSIENEYSRQKMSENVREYLHRFYQKYGSFIPLENNDILKFLEEKFNKDFGYCEIMILEVIIEEMAKMIHTIPYFEVKYKKHKLTLEDLSTLASENWLNDQVINMYGELILDSANSKVHFLNSFFHKQLLNKGYEGVKRWTKQVDLFSKRLLLVPVHVEVHWCLVTADFVKKTVCLYDSQGIGLQKVARNIVEYLLKEAKEKKQSAFEKDWTVSMMEEIPQQSNENDCGVFVLEYSRCLALSQPLQFSQRDIPGIRKRMYKELCDRSLH